MKTGTLDTVKGPPATPPRPRSSSGAGEGNEGILSRPTAWWDRARTFLTEVRNEMRRVTWPSRREVYATTIVVIITSAFFGLYLFTLDQLLTTFVQWIFRTFGAA